MPGYELALLFAFVTLPGVLLRFFAAVRLSAPHLPVNRRSGFPEHVPIPSLKDFDTGTALAIENPPRRDYGARP